MEAEGQASRSRTELRWVSRCDGGTGLIGELLAGGLADIDDVIILLPTRRIVQEAKLRMARGKGGFTGMIMTPGDLPRHLYDMLKGSAPVMDVSSRQYLVREIMTELELRSLVRAGDVRPGMVNNVSMTLGELISEGVSHRDLERAARNGRSRELVEVHRRYIGELRKRNMVDPDMLAAGSLALLEGSELRLSSLGIYLPGELPGTLSSLISALAGRSDRTLVMEHASREVPRFLEFEEVPERPGFDPSVPLPGLRALSRMGSKRTFPSISGMDPMEEARSVLRDIKASCQKGSDTASVTIVLPSKRARDDVVRAAALEYGVPVDQGEDTDLMMVPVVSAVFELLGLAGEGFRRRSVVECLSSPFLSLLDDAGERITGQQLELLTRTAAMAPTRRRVKEGWSDPLLSIERDDGMPDDVRLLSSRCRKPLVSLLELLDTAHRSRSTIAGHVSSVRSIMDRTGVESGLSRVVEEGGGPFEMNSYGFQALGSLLRSMERRSRVLAIGRVSFSDFLDSLRLEASRKRIRSAARVAGVQVMGLEEAAGLDLGKAYFMDLVEGSIPSVNGSFRLLADAERADLGLPVGRERRERLELLAMALGSTEEPVLCHHRNQGDRLVLRSSFIEDLSLEEVDPGSDPRSRLELHRRIGELIDPAGKVPGAGAMSVPELIAGSGEDALRLRRGVVSFRRRRQAEANEHSGRIVDDDLLSVIRDRFGPDHVWSVTQFETFRKCPYQFLVRYLLRIEELEDLEPGIPPEKRGLIFHEVAERFYDRFRKEHDRRVTVENIPMARSLIREVTGQVMDAYPNAGPYWDALKDQLLGLEGEEGLLDCFLDTEAVYPGHFLVDGTELRFGLPEGSLPAVDVSLPGETDSLDRFRLRGSIDRVDVLSTRDGDIDFIWDYKTGGSDVDPESVQVFLYLAALRKLRPANFPGGGGYYYVRKRGSIQRAPVHGEDIWSGKVLDRDGLQAHIGNLGEEVHSTVRRCLEFIDSIRAGDLSPQQGCKERYCKFDNICRRREQ
ncbi:MAG: PD-(D/E)XK nuclease family protein [Thermoplasmatota archaeon]